MSLDKTAKKIADRVHSGRVSHDATRDRALGALDRLTARTLLLLRQRETVTGMTGSAPDNTRVQTSGHSDGLHIQRKRELDTELWQLASQTDKITNDSECRVKMPILREHGKQELNKQD